YKILLSSSSLEEALLSSNSASKSCNHNALPTILLVIDFTNLDDLI
ncbi:4235_t:CDS:2, partial [Funneliformis caledonium]